MRRDGETRVCVVVSVFFRSLCPCHEQYRMCLCLGFAVAQKPPLIAPIDALTTAVYNTYLMQYFLCLNDTHCLTQHHHPAIEIS